MGYPEQRKTSRSGACYELGNDLVSVKHLRGEGKETPLKKRRCVEKRSSRIGEPHEMASLKNHPEISSKSPNRGSITTFCMVFVLFLGNIVVQSWALRKQARPETDEGVYLYQAKLITQGYLPYKDFAMTTGHVPFLMYLNAFMLKLCNFDMFTYHLVYTVWVFLTIFPLFYTVLYFTRSRFASIFSIVLFSTFPALVESDAHFFAIRQASLPFFACFVYFFFVEKKEKFSYVFLSLFSFCLITNFFISLVFVITVLMHSYIKQNISMKEWIKRFVCIYLVFALLNCIYFGIILLIPGSISNLLAVVQKDTSPYLQRAIDVKGMMPLNWPIFLFGALGIFFLMNAFPFLSILSMLTFLIPLLISGPFYTHHMVVIAVPFAIMGGIFIYKLFILLPSNEIKIALTCMIFLSLYQTVSSDLSANLITETTPDFFQTVHILEHSPEPLFTLQPIYALYAHKNLVMYYNTADMRIFRVMGTNLSYDEYRAILKRSNTVLLEPFADQMLPQRIKEELFQKYDLKYTDGTERVYVKKIVTRTSMPSFILNRRSNK
jgi:hypothetical protein